jgi:thioredoxin-related protein
MTIEEAYALSMTAKDPKPIFIDVYTDWCGWCKRMDKETFQDAKVAAYMNETFYNVKFDAEHKESINIMDHEFKFVGEGRRGYNELAAALLNGKMSYPTVVFMNAKFEMITPVPGYQAAGDFNRIAHFIGSEAYKNQSFEDFSASYKPE